MKGLFGVVSLLLALVIVGVLVKQQLSATRQSVPLPSPAVPTTTDGGTRLPMGAVREQAQQTQQQYKQAVEAVMQPPRVMPDDQ